MYQLDNTFMVVVVALTMLVWSLHFYFMRNYSKPSSSQVTPG